MEYNRAWDFLRNNSISPTEKLEEGDLVLYGEVKRTTRSTFESAEDEYDVTYKQGIIKEIIPSSNLTDLENVNYKLDIGKGKLKPKSRMEIIVKLNNDSE